jgi:hypothetical protein
MPDDKIPDFGANTPPEDWWERAKQARERIETELGDREFPDVVEIIHQMRNERDIEILSTIYGEEGARDGPGFGCRNR